MSAMITKRPAEQRGHANYGWLDTWHTFSFADYHDPEQMGWGPLRVINDDTVSAGRGFGTHGHRDMEIISVVLAGELAHQDSMGHGTVIRPGEVQRMSAGKGVMHSEFNPSAEQPAHFLQIWIQPAARGGAPSYEQKTIAPVAAGHWQCLASPDGRDGSVQIQQDAHLSRIQLNAGQSAEVTLTERRLGYLHVVSGAITIGTTNGSTRLRAGDGAKISAERQLTLNAETTADFLFFDLPDTDQ